MKRMMMMLMAMAVTLPLAAQTTMEAIVESHAATRTIEGSWELEVVSDPGPGAPPPFKALITFMPGGGVIETILLPPVVPAHGEWVQNARGRYSFAVVHPLLNASGAHIGTVRATSHVRVTSSREFTATFEGHLFDPDGNVIAPISGSETGKRISVD